MDETITAVKQHQGILNQSRCPEEVKQYVQGIPDGLVCEWLYICALDGMGLEQLKKLNEAPVKESLKKAILIQKERQKFLAGKYWKDPETLRQVEELRQRVSELHEESRELRHAVDTSLQDAMKYQEETARKQETSLYHLIGGKNEQIKERDKKIEELEGQLRELKKEQEQMTAYKKTALEEKDREETGHRDARPKKGRLPCLFRRDPARIFIRRYLENEAFTQEQREYLIQCLEEGDTAKEMEQYAIPALSTDMMERLRKMIKKQR